MRYAIFFTLILTGCRPDQDVIDRNEYRYCLKARFDACIEAIAPSALSATALANTAAPSPGDCAAAAKVVCESAYPKIASEAMNFPNTGTD